MTLSKSVTGLLPWLRENAASLMVLITLGGGIWYFATELVRKDDIKELATVSDIENMATQDDLDRAVETMQLSLTTAVDQLDATVNRLAGTVTGLEAAIGGLNTTTTNLDQTSRMMVTCIVQVHHEWALAYVTERERRTSAFYDYDPPGLPDVCDELRSR